MRDIGMEHDEYFAMEPKSGQRVVSFIFLATVILLSASIAFIYYAGLIAIEANQGREATVSALDQLQTFLSDLKDAETGQRGFVLTGEEEYLRPYSNVRSKLQTQLDELRKLALSGVFSTDSVEHLALATHQKLDELEQTIQLRRGKGLSAALAVVENN